MLHEGQVLTGRRTAIGEQTIEILNVTTTGGDDTTAFSRVIKGANKVVITNITVIVEIWTAGTVNVQIDDRDATIQVDLDDIAGTGWTNRYTTSPALGAVGQQYNHHGSNLVTLTPNFLDTDGSPLIQFRAVVNELTAWTGVTAHAWINYIPVFAG